MNFRYTLIVVLLLGLLGTDVHAQDSLVIKSQFLKQSDTTIVYTPNDYTKDKEYPLLFLLHGYSGNYKQWSNIADLQAASNRYQFIIVTPDGFKSWYLNSPERSNSQYEVFFFSYLSPLIQERYSVSQENIFVSGLSMGGYGALRLFIKNPDYFNSAGSTSGGVDFDIKEFSQTSRQFFGDETLLDHHEKLLGSKNQGTWTSYSIPSLIRKKRYKLQDQPFIFDVGMSDPFYPMNIRLMRLCNSLGIPATFVAQPGDHSKEYWKASLHRHLDYFKSRLN